MGLGLPKIQRWSGMIYFTKRDYDIIIVALERYKHKKGKPWDNEQIEGVCKRTRHLMNITYGGKLNGNI